MIFGDTPYRVVNTPDGQAVLLDAKRAYSNVIGRKLIITDRISRSTLAAIDGRTTNGEWVDGPRIEVEFRDCICGQCP